MSNTLPNVAELLAAGQAAVVREDAEKEASKRGVLRGGSSGIITEDGKNYGECPRKAYLRSIGVQEAKEGPEQKMFAAGRVNEDILYNWLGKVYSGIIYREGELGVEWETSSGVRVTGSPDLILADKDGTPVKGIEAKLVSSVWTANSVHYKLQPRNSHLIQAAHYSMALNFLPYDLVYSSRVDWHFGQLGSDFMGSEPRAVAWRRSFIGKPDVELNEAGEPKRILPFDRVYELTWERDRLHFFTKGMPKPQTTVISAQNIARFYEHIAEMEATKSLGPRPHAGHVAKGAYFSACAYCPLKTLCDQNVPFDEWRDHATNILTTK